ncbi:MAG TPA: BamA/TamA family outer membrane protein [Flavobacterium sp.]|nr:BamA/TamA family outer membrane protein [Flavobacterium sp.]
MSKPLRSAGTKISLFILIGLFISACDTVKKVPNNKKLLTKTQIVVNDKRETGENIQNLLYQKPNSSLLGYHLRLNLYNLAKLNHDSLYQSKFIKDPEKYRRKSKWLSAKQVNRLGQSFWYAGIHNFLRDNGEPPVIIDPKSTQKSAIRLKSYYFNNGYFNVKTRFEVDSLKPKKAAIKYFVTTGNPFFVDTLKTTISTPVLDSMYRSRMSNSFIRTGKQYKTEDFENERNRITTHFRNNGVYYFQPNNINFDIDTLNANFKANVNMKITDYSYREGDSTTTVPFKQYKISQVNIYTDFPANKSRPGFEDTLRATYRNFNLWGSKKLKYRPRAITDAVFINQGNLFSDLRTTLTTRYLSNLKIFNYPTIQYIVDPADTLQSSLIANIYLQPRKKYSFGASLDVTHSNIQDFGISAAPTLTIRNVFNGAETFEISARGNIGSSKDLANPNDAFFNVSEYGVDLKLNFPRIFMFFKTEKIIPKSMIPSTTLSMGIAKQENIGLDKENFTSALSYNWSPKRNYSARFDLFNIQYVNNINTQNYFKIYSSSYKTLNTLAQAYNVDPSLFVDPNATVKELKIDEGVNVFINSTTGANGTPITIPTIEADRKTISSIAQRRERLTENNLIFASNFSFTKTTKTDTKDEDYYGFKTKIESAGNFLSLMSKLAKNDKNDKGNTEIFGLEYSQYIKGEFDYIKHWDLGRKRVLAFRSFGGIAIPYGNSNSIPFSRSYFAGGTNDNRAWQAYSLGPGSTAALNDFNEANLKIAISAEYRFNFFGQFNGALFVDTGNIWNLLDNIEDEKATFNGLRSLEDIAVGSGLGFRYDFSFFVVRLDFGFKTYNPSDTSGKKWFRDYNFGNSVANIGINYPF